MDLILDFSSYPNENRSPSSWTIAIAICYLPSHVHSNLNISSGHECVGPASNTQEESFPGPWSRKSRDCACYEAWPLILSNPGISKIKTEAVVRYVSAHVSQSTDRFAFPFFLLESLADTSARSIRNTSQESPRDDRVLIATNAFKLNAPL